MNRKTLTILTVAAVVLIGGIAFAVSMLYSGSGSSGAQTEDSLFQERHKLIEAIPSDAAIVLCAKNFGRICEILGDSLAVFGELASDKFGGIASGQFNSLRKTPAIMSVHYSKDMPALLVLEAGQSIADSTADLRRLLDVAGSCGLHTRINGTLLLISPSETIINSSVRHLEEGHNILEAQGFLQAASTVRHPGEDLLFCSNAYTDKILGLLMAKKHRKTYGFIKELAEWTSFSIESRSRAGVRMLGEMLYGNDPSYYLNVLGHTGTPVVEITDAVPGATDFILDIPVGDIASYIKAYRNYLDAKAVLMEHDRRLSRQKKEFGLNAEEWALNLNIKEIALTTMRFGDSCRPLVLIRSAAVTDVEKVRSITFPGFAGTIFGEVFKAEDETAVAVVGRWIAIGARECVTGYSETGFLEKTLTSRLKACCQNRLPQKNCRAWIYHSPGENPNLTNANFTPMMADRIREILKGTAYVPVTLSLLQEEGRLSADFAVDRIEAGKGNAVLPSARDTSVKVPNGPFKVHNHATGKIYTLYQNSHLSICMKDENGKDLWGVPFKARMCGYVQEIDYYNNGKIQYLFAAGSGLYLIDRLGRFVSGFPAETGKIIAAGPTVYDFTGAKGYTTMVLHKDNTVGYYDLHGNQVSSWKGITADETIKSLPELLEGNGKRYWVVRTSAQAMVFPFCGGKPLVKGEGSRMIRPDSKISITDKGFSAECYDGKVRTFKSEE